MTLNIQLLDTETSPIKGYTWGVYDQTVLKVLEPSQIMSFAAKQLGSNEAMVRCQADYKGYKAGVLNDKHLLGDLWTVLDQADIVIAQNGDKFDFPKVNARFVMQGMKPPSPYKTIDTLKIAKKYFKFDSNKLGDLARYLNVVEKLSTGGFSLWENCIAGVPEAWTTMKDYNLGDIITLEDVYLKIRPWAVNHPDLAFLSNPEASEVSCSTCLSHNIQKRGFSVTKTTKKQRYQCSDCGSWFSGPSERIKKT